MAFGNNPHVSSEGWDQVRQSHHCADCGDAMIIRGVVVKDHALMNWQHYCFINYPGIVAKNETGHTIEGVFAIPPRRTLALVPKQVSISFCLDCVPVVLCEDCVVCGESVDPETEHSTCEYLEKYKNGVNLNFRILKFHHDCLPELFSEVRAYKAKYGAEPEQE